MSSYTTILVLVLLIIVQSTCFKFNNKVSNYKLLLNQVSSPTTSLSSLEYNTLAVKTFLNTVLSSRSSINDKKIMIEQLQGLRANENPEIPRNEDRSIPAVWNGDRETFLNAMLKEIDDVNDTFGLFRMLKFLPSYRVKLLILRSLIDRILIQETNNNSNTVDPARRRRALSIILGQLPSTEKGIRQLATEADRRSRNENSYEEMLSRTPEKLETPKFDIVHQLSKTSHVRKYDKFSVCSLIMDPNINQNGGAFNFLAGYIFGKNKNSNGISEKMAMTTPVLNVQSSGKQKMSFVLPSKYWDDTSNAPAPIDDVVKLEQKYMGDETFAAIWYGGYSTSALVDMKTKELIEAIERDPEWKLKDNNTDRESFVLQYNDPFQPAWKRRNEILLKVERI